MDKLYYIGIDLGGTSIKMGICSVKGEIIRELEKPTPHGSYTYVLKAFKDLRDQLLYELQIEKSQVIGVGVGVPALLDVEAGHVYEIVNLGWKDVPLKKELERCLGLPSFVDNDANTAAIGEMWQGAGKGKKHLMCITLGTGVGGGLILNGNVYHGAGGLAGELGHFTVKAENGLPCNCGKSGCLETEASATAISYYGRKAIAEGEATSLSQIEAATGWITAKDVIDEAKKGDQVCLRILNHAGYYLGLTLAQISNILNPEMIVIGGGVSQAGDLLLKPIRQHFERFALQQVSLQAEILPARLGNKAGWLGAAWLVHRNLGHIGA